MAKRKLTPRFYLAVFNSNYTVIGNEQFARTMCDAIETLKDEVGPGTVPNVLHRLYERLYEQLMIAERRQTQAKEGKK